MPSEINPNFHGCHIGTSDSVKQHKLRKFIACLADQKARGMEFISLYIPKNISKDEVIAVLKKESESEGDRDVRARLQNNLKNVIQHLKIENDIPANGLALFAGTFFTKGGKNEDTVVEEIIPPEPITAYLSNVDDHFRLEPLREMLRNQTLVGFAALDSKEATLGIVKSERLESIANITSGISGKSSKGGSSQRRYERERDSAVSNFFHRIATHMAKVFLEDLKVTALIVGGPGTTKEDFLKGDYLNYELQNSVVSVVDTQTAGKEALKEMLDKSVEVRQSICSPDERRIVQRLMTAIGKQDGLAIYGLDSVLLALGNGVVNVAMVTDTSGVLEIIAVCKKCANPKTQIVRISDKILIVQKMISTPCEKCGAKDYEMEEKDIIDVLEDAASQTNARVEVISTDSKEKAQLTALGGFAALLRYRKTE